MSYIGIILNKVDYNDNSAYGKYCGAYYGEYYGKYYGSYYGDYYGEEESGE